MSMMFQNATQEENNVKMITYDDFQNLVDYYKDKPLAQINELVKVLVILKLGDSFLKYVNSNNIKL